MRRLIMPLAIAVAVVVVVVALVELGHLKNEVNQLTGQERRQTGPPEMTDEDWARMTGDVLRETRKQAPYPTQRDNLERLVPPEFRGAVDKLVPPTKPQIDRRLSPEA